MTDKEFRKQKDYKYNHFLQLTSTGISPNYDSIEEFAEAYHQSKVNNGVLDDVMVCEHETTKVKALHGRFYSVCIKCGEVIN